MTKFQRLQQALTILQEELYPSAMEVHLLETRLRCVKCAKVENILGQWKCKIHGPIPKGYEICNCDQWELWRYP